MTLELSRLGSWPNHALQPIPVSAYGSHFLFRIYSVRDKEHISHSYENSFTICVHMIVEKANSSNVYFGKNSSRSRGYILWTGFIPSISKPLAMTAATASHRSIRHMFTFSTFPGETDRHQLNPQIQSHQITGCFPESNL